MRVPVTEDDEVLAAAVAAGLRQEGMALDVALDGAAALEHLAVSRYDVLVLDRDLPGGTAKTSAGPSPRADPRPGW
jgi:DNA-binding response OmpR family regulator